jgi:hypothetical protein
VFEHVSIWATVRSDVLLLGFRDDTHALDLARLEARSAEPDFKAGLRRAGVHGLADLLAHELVPLGVVNSAGFSGETHTLLRPLLSDRASRAFFRGGRADMPGLLHPTAAGVGERNSLLGRLAASRGGRLAGPERANAIAELCYLAPPQCATQLAFWAREEPESPLRERLLATLRQNPRLERDLDAARLRRLASLFEPEPGDGPPIEPSRARSETLLFASSYSYVTPFHRARLEEIWRRCAPGPGDPGDACTSGRSEAENLVGPLR